MTYAGAEGGTEEQMAKALHFTMDKKKIHAAFASLEKGIRPEKGTKGYTLSVANSLWVQKDYRLLEGFLSVIRKNYDAGVNQVDFRTSSEAVRKEINVWVEEHTNNKIKDLIQRGTVDPLTRLVLVNAIYFKGIWASQFEKRLTLSEPFKVAPGKTLDVPMMTKKESFGYMENQLLQALELPYVGNELTMVVLLPKKTDGLAELENSLNPQTLDQWLALLRSREVQVYLPKYAMRSQFQLAETLSSMGMPDAFTPDKADFSGMDGTRLLFISAVIHKAFVEVNEEGTEAAAATGVAMRLTASFGPSPVFRADHPFVFLIRDTRSGSILFLGRVVDPAK
jgi:serpin B